MPIYSYKCNKCESDFEKLVKNSDEEVTCSICGNLSEKNDKLYPNGFNFKGNWFKNSGTY